jgi:hypothetical protein
MSGDDTALERNMKDRRLKMVGLFVASNAIELLSEAAAKFADDHNYHQTAQIIRRISPYAVKSVDLFSKMDSNKRIASLERVLARDISEIKRNLYDLKKGAVQSHAVGDN